MPGWCHKGPCEGSQWPCATFIAAAGQQQSACPHGRSTGKNAGCDFFKRTLVKHPEVEEKRSRMWFAHIIATDCACSQQWVSSLHTVLPLGTGSKLKHTEAWCATFSLYSNKHKEHCHDFEASARLWRSLCSGFKHLHQVREVLLLKAELGCERVQVLDGWRRGQGLSDYWRHLGQPGRQKSLAHNRSHTFQYFTFVTEWNHPINWQVPWLWGNIEGKKFLLFTPHGRLLK